MYKNLLIPTGGTEFSEKAIRHGVALAKLAGAKVTGVTVTNSFRGFAGVPVPRVDQIVHLDDGIVAAMTTIHGATRFDEQVAPIGEGL